MLKKSLLAACLALVVTAFWIIEPFGHNPLHTPTSVPVETSWDKRCDAAMSATNIEIREPLIGYVESGRLLGASAGFYSEDCGSYKAGVGYRSKKNLEPFQSDTVTRIASITKPMTAVAVMQLNESGQIDIDAPIQTYLPEFPVTQAPVSVRNVLSHTSGIPHYESDIDAMSFTHYPSLKLAANEVYSRGFTNAPGERFVYSSYGYTVLGRVIEAVTGMKFEDYLTENIWQVAGMDSTSLEDAHSAANKSRLYIKVGEVFVRSPHTDLSIIHPAGGVQSTAEDLLRFGRAILDNTLISREMLEVMTDTADSLAPQAGDDPYGLGWSVYEDPGYGTVISHGGAQPGVSAQLRILLDKGVVAVALSNAYGTKSSIIELTFAMTDRAVNIQNHALNDEQGLKTAGR